jgi:hypothetical protein
VEGNRWFRTGYLRDRLAVDAGSPLNINGVGQRLQLLQQDERIQRLNAELRPGLKGVSANSAYRVIASGAKQSLPRTEIASSPPAPRNDTCFPVFRHTLSLVRAC